MGSLGLPDMLFLCHLFLTLTKSLLISLTLFLLLCFHHALSFLLHSPAGSLVLFLLRFPHALSFLLHSPAGSLVLFLLQHFYHALLFLLHSPAGSLTLFLLL
jgi:hypothetical protein